MSNHELAKERPILFSGDMVRAILDGRKTQTRRVVKPQPAPEYHISLGKTAAGWVWSNGAHANPCEPECCTERRCPYGQPGDRLWVRETFHQCPHCPDAQVSYRAGGWCKVGRESRYDDRPLRPKCQAHGWRPSIYMPRWASRITLEVTAVRVERLQDISEADAVAEGFRRLPLGCSRCAAKMCSKHQPPEGQFANLWDSINAKRGHSWESNCWVWVVEFRRIEA